MKIRRAAIKALACALILAAAWTWLLVRSASVADYLITVAILTVPLFAWFAIRTVGDALLDEDQGRAAPPPNMSR